MCFYCLAGSDFLFGAVVADDLFEFKNNAVGSIVGMDHGYYKLVIAKLLQRCNGDGFYPVTGAWFQLHKRVFCGYLNIRNNYDLSSDQLHLQLFTAKDIPAFNVAGDVTYSRCMGR